MAIRVLLAISERLLRESLREALPRRYSVDVVGEAADGRAALDLVRALEPDLVVIQPELKELNGADVVRQLRTERPALPVVAVSSRTDHPPVIRVMRAGACGLVLADGGLDELHLAITSGMEGRVYVSPALEPLIAGSPVDTSSSDILTPREIEVLQLLAEGKSTKRIADALAVGTKTVETHRLHLMAKLGLFSVAELTRYAIRQGITTALD
jgi:DNA-binding NarL/FixJ family response regulator